MTNGPPLLITVTLLITVGNKSPTYSGTGTEWQEVTGLYIYMCRKMRKLITISILTPEKDLLILFSRFLLNTF